MVHVYLLESGREQSLRSVEAGAYACLDTERYTTDGWQARSSN